jgi:hypothetical protein
MDEALDASRMAATGYDVARIRAEIDWKYGR